jgi:hypothetical protein
MSVGVAVGVMLGLGITVSPGDEAGVAGVAIRAHAMRKTHWVRQRPVLRMFFNLTFS